MALGGRLHFRQPSLVKFLLVMLSAISFAQENPKNSKPNTTNFVDKIRRQLMENNYDYLDSAESTTPTTTPLYDDYIDTTTTTKTPLDPSSALWVSNKPQKSSYMGRSNNARNQDYSDERKTTKQTTHNFDIYDDQDNKRATETADNRSRELDQYANDINRLIAQAHNSADYLDNNGGNALSSKKQDYSSSAEDLKPSTSKRGYYDDGNIKTHTLDPQYNLDRGFSVGQNDLLYYMDDKRMRRMGGDDLSSNSTSTESEDSEQKTAETPPGNTSTVKYKVIKMKGGYHRRHMAARRFVEEKNAEGVAIFRLDDEPFPQFRLPSARRQYMGGEQPNENDLPGSNTSS